MTATRFHPRFVCALLGVASGLLAMVVAYPLRSVLSGQVHVPMFTQSIAFIDQPGWFALITILFSCPVIILLAFSLFLFRNAGSRLELEGEKLSQGIHELLLSWVFSAFLALACLLFAPKFRDLESGIFYAGKRNSPTQVADEPLKFWFSFSIEAAGIILLGFSTLAFLVAGTIAYRKALKPSKEDQQSKSDVA